jgi:hypothetical protein
VRRSLLPDGTPKAPKTEAGVRAVPMLPALRRLVAAWKLRSPWTRPGDLVVCTADGAPVQERNLRRALDDAKRQSNLDATADRLSRHSLRHSFASMLATDLELPATTLALLTGHADAGFTLKVYARDGRDETTVVEAVLDFEALKSREERKATFTAVDKLAALGPKLLPPHAKSLKGEPGLYELRPRAGRSQVRPIYRRTGDDYVILAVAIAADKADFDAAVARARARFSSYDA